MGRISKAEAVASAYKYILTAPTRPSAIQTLIARRVSDHDGTARIAGRGVGLVVEGFGVRRLGLEKIRLVLCFLRCMRVRGCTQASARGGSSFGGEAWDYRSRLVIRFFRYIDAHRQLALARQKLKRKPTEDIVDDGLGDADLRVVRVA